MEANCSTSGSQKEAMIQPKGQDAGQLGRQEREPNQKVREQSIVRVKSPRLGGRKCQGSLETVLGRNRYSYRSKEEATRHSKLEKTITCHSGQLQRRHHKLSLKKNSQGRGGEKGKKLTQFQLGVSPKVPYEYGERPLRSEYEDLLPHQTTKTVEEKKRFARGVGFFSIVASAKIGTGGKIREGKLARVGTI